MPRSGHYPYKTMPENDGILRVSINVSKVDKSALIKGQKGTYLDVSILMKDGPNEFGDHGMAVQGIGKERREAGEKGPILGNAKWVVEPSYMVTPPPAQAPNSGPGQPAKVEPEDDDFPF